MATSGTVNTTSYDGRYYQLTWSATQSVTNNTSTVSWTLSAVGGNSGYYAERTLKVVIGGKTVYTKTNSVNRYTGTVTSGTTTIEHNSDGTKSFSISIQAAVYYAEVNCKGSATFELNQIARLSTLSAPNGTLGSSATLTITRKDTTFKHKLSYSCGSYSGYILGSASGYSTTTSTSFTPSLSLATTNTTGSTVSIKFTLETYTSAGALVGSKSYTKSFTIPSISSTSPSCSISVSDALGYYGTYGSYIKGKSKLNITVSGTAAYSSPISAYKTTVDGKDYATASFRTDVLNSSGTLSISAKVTDKRGNSGTATSTISVLDYAEPVVSKLSVHRCKSATDGTENSSGGYVKVTYSGTITSLNSKNSTSFAVKYKKYGTSSWYTASTDTSNYSVTDGYCIFKADTGYSYEVKVEAKDAFKTTTRTTSVSSAYTMMHFSANGKGLGLGKVAEFDGLDVNFVSRFKGNVQVGSKTGYLDGLQGVHLNKEGYIHLQRNNTTKHPYIAFIHGDSKALDCYIRYTQASKLLEFMKAAGYTFDGNTYVGSNTAWYDGVAGVKFSPSGYMAIQGGNGTSPYIDFLKYGQKSDYNSRIQYNWSTGKLEFMGASDYDFDSGAIGIGSDDKTGATAAKIYCWWCGDQKAHNMLAHTKTSKNVDQLAVGWSGDSTYTSLLELRGTTVSAPNNGGVTVVSDERLKKDFAELNKWEEFFNALEPCAYKYKTGTSGRYHLGFKAQQVEEALLNNNLSTQDFAGFVKLQYSVDEDSPTRSKAYEEAGINPGDDEYGLIYNEFTALNTHMIQKLLKENAELNKKVNDLEDRLSKLEAVLNTKTE